MVGVYVNSDFMDIDDDYDAARLYTIVFIILTTILSNHTKLYFSQLLLVIRKFIVYVI